jgi:hypothetical protein
MPFGNSLTSESDAPTQVPLHHAFFPNFSFDASLFPPANNGLPPSVPITCVDVLEAARQKEFREANATPEERLQIAIDETNSATVEAVRELVKILRDPKVSEGAKLNATAQILGNALKHKDLTEMQKRLETLEKLTESKPGNSVLKPSKRHRIKALTEEPNNE